MGDEPGRIGPGDGAQAPAVTARKALRATIWFSLASYLTLGIALVRSIVLARLIAPEAFGILAIAVFLAGAIGVLRNLGINYALQHKERVDARTESAYLWLGVGSSILCVLVAAAVFPLIASAYTADTAWAVVALSGILVVQSVGSLPGSLLERELRFTRVSAINITSAVIKATVAILLAMNGYGLWALVAVEAADALVRLVLAPILRPIAPSLWPDRETLRFFLSYAWRLWSSGVAGVIFHLFNNALVGTVVGVRAAGFYSKATELGQYPAMLTSSIISRVTLPTYARLQTQPEALSRAYTMVLSVLLRVSVLLALLLVAGAGEFTQLLLGERWMPMVPVVQVLAPFVALRPVLDDVLSILAATGRPEVLTRLMWLQAAVLVGLGVPGVYLWGMSGAALALDAAIVAGVTAFFISYGRKMVRVSLMRVAAAPALAAVGAAAVVYLLDARMPVASPVVEFFTDVALASVVYLIIIAIAEGSSIREQVRYVLERLRGDAGDAGGTGGTGGTEAGA